MDPDPACAQCGSRIRIRNLIYADPHAFHAGVPTRSMITSPCYRLLGSMPALSWILALLPRAHDGHGSRPQPGPQQPPRPRHQQPQAGEAHLHPQTDDHDS